MIKPVQQKETIQTQILKKIKNAEKKTNFGNEKEVSPELMAAQYKYGLACLYAASAKLENEKLKQELANATAQVNYRKAC
ncbi:hypothetical protein IJS77_00770 [bacterium]|nr:hypothetical protein [bacterium]